MPAVTVDNPLTLPKVAAQGDAAARPVLAVTTAPSGFEGEGFPVRRAFAGINYRHLDPFIMMDQMGEVEYQPGEPTRAPRGTRTQLRDRDVPDRRDLHSPGTPTAAAARSRTATPSG
ncbi:hypothetical protein SCALM49S_10111 [Streptomyces californicus]